MGLALSGLAAAQTTPSALAAAEERAQREAERVFSVIKFHSIRSKPAAEAASRSRAAAPRTERPARTVPAAAAAPVPAAEPSLPAVEAGTTAPATPEPVPSAWQATPAAPPVVAPHDEPVPTAPALPAEPESEPEEPDEVPLRLQHFVAPVLSPSLQATLGAGARNVRVRLTVQADGTVSQADAAAGVPRRLAKPATDAILQWQFAPLPQARTADVDIAFRRD